MHDNTRLPSLMTHTSCTSHKDNDGFRLWSSGLACQADNNFRRNTPLSPLNLKLGAENLFENFGKYVEDYTAVRIRLTSQLSPPRKRRISE